MTDGEKLIVLMLADISKRLGGQPDIDPDFVEQTIYANQLWGFDWQFTGIPFERSDETPRVVEETVDILEMFSLAMFHFQELPELEQVRTELGYSAHDLDKFPGFDGNNDAHYGVAAYLVKHLRRFKDLPGATNNSHTQTSLPRYRKMLSVYLPMRDRLGSGRLTSKQIIEIFSA
ncbi:YfbU family protein [Bradyrhizobium sp. CCGUVB1N3]|uniref:YfbU family protein n=1 Tax=Bradyrhizobium sp. CCGUVB1N3 TaxID=2949629 RepID=UPI0020B2F31E|nr:YfbU family protein [Bradyrhizobium sp. CCGUVB1N3]MCP3472400.1 YfbU family protein [Bradyrhizobium sp. CCGUVB1N3]